MRIRFWLCSALCSAVIACSPAEPGEPSPTPPRSVESTFEKFFIRATNDEPEAQNLLGYMLFFGEGVPQDRVGAQYWFERASRQGHAGALLNLAVMYQSELGGASDPDVARRYFERWRKAPGARSGNPDISDGSLAETIARIRAVKQTAAPVGQRRYEKFCAGCHGFNGIAAFVRSPSFAVGERLEKRDAELLRSMKDGHGAMPAWGSLLNDQDRKSILAYIRTFPLRYGKGIALPRREPPQLFYRFGPLENFRSAL